MRLKEFVVTGNLIFLLHNYTLIQNFYSEFNSLFRVTSNFNVCTKILFEIQEGLKVSVVHV